MRDEQQYPCSTTADPKSELEGVALFSVSEFSILKCAFCHICCSLHQIKVYARKSVLNLFFYVEQPICRTVTGFSKWSSLTLQCLWRWCYRLCTRWSLVGVPVIVFSGVCIPREGGVWYWGNAIVILLTFFDCFFLMPRKTSAHICIGYLLRSVPFLRL